MQQKATQMQLLREAFRLQDTPTYPRENTYGRKTVRMQRMRQRFHPTHQLEHAHSGDPFPRETLQVQTVREQFRNKTAARRPRQKTHRRKTLQVPFLREKFHREGHLEHPREDTHGRKTVQVLVLRQAFREKREQGFPREDAHGRKAPRLQRVRRQLHPSQHPQGPLQGEAFAREAAQVRVLRERFRDETRAGRSRTDTYGREAVRLREMRDGLRAVDYPEEAPGGEAFGGETFQVWFLREGLCDEGAGRATRERGACRWKSLEFVMAVGVSVVEGTLVKNDNGCILC